MEKKRALLLVLVVILVSYTVAGASLQPEMVEKFQYFFRVIGAITILSAIFFYVSKATAQLHQSLLKWKYWDSLKKNRNENDPNLSEKKTKELVTYLENCRKMFYPRKRVAKALQNFGWDDETIDKMISKFYK